MNHLKPKEHIITDMCYTYRHDYGLEKLDNDPSWASGMTKQDATMLYKTMEQIYNNEIEPILEHYKKLENGESVVLPVDKEHAEAMVKVGMFYLENNNESKQSE